MNCSLPDDDVRHRNVENMNNNTNVFLSVLNRIELHKFRYAEKLTKLVLVITSLIVPLSAYRINLFFIRRQITLKLMKITYN